MEGTRHRAVFRYHPRWGHAFRAGLYVRVAHYEPHNRRDRSSYLITTNSQGGRTRHEPRPSGEGIHDVLWLGCSFTAGDGVSNPHRFPDLVEEALEGVRCHNWALSGSGNDQQYLIHREVAPLIRPEVLVLSPYVGCIGRNLVEGRESFDPFCARRVFRPKPYFTLRGGRLHLHHQPVPRARLLPSRRPGRRSLGERLRHALGGRLRRLCDPEAERLGTQVYYRRPRSRAYRLTRAILLQTLAESRARYKVLLPLPHHLYFRQGEPPHYLSLFQEVAHRSGALLWDPLPLLRRPSGVTVEELTLSHHHYSEPCHRLLAGFLAPRLAELLGLPRRGKHA